MLATLIPRHEEEMARLAEIGPSGFIMGFGWGLRGMEFMDSTYPPEWRSLYESRNYFVGDPALIWHMTHVGQVRWSEIKAPDLRGVMAEARKFDLNYGAMFSRKTKSQRSFLSISRADRELTDDEMAEIASKFSTWVEIVLERASLTDAELQVLRGLRDGFGQREIAESLGIGETTVKQRAIRACGKLGAASRTQAVAIAVARNYFNN